MGSSVGSPVVLLQIARFTKARACRTGEVVGVMYRHLLQVAHHRMREGLSSRVTAQPHAKAPHIPADFML